MIQKILLVFSLLVSNFIWAQVDSPNFIFILTDDQGWNDLSFPLTEQTPESYYRFVNTPNLKAFSEEGVSFTNAYAPAANCTPTRRSIQFGMSPARQRGTEFVSEFTKEENLTIPEVLKWVNPDYLCAHLGKWGEAMIGDYNEDLKASPKQVFGYDISDGATGNVDGTFYHKLSEFFDLNFVLNISEDPKRVISLTDRAIEFIDQANQQSKPFYLQVSYYSVHRAYETLAATAEKYSSLTQDPSFHNHTDPSIYPMLEDLDSQIARIFELVKQLDMEKNTYIIFSSDNGGAGWDNSYGVTRNNPLRGFKNTILEGGIRVPFFVKGPGVPADIKNNSPIMLYDLLPTLLDLAGGAGSLATHLNKSVDGVSLAKLFHQAEMLEDNLPPRSLYWHNPYNPRFRASALRKGQYKLLINWSENYNEKTVRLFNLEEDVAELKDISSDSIKLTYELHDELISYLTRVDAELPVNWPDFGSNLIKKEIPLSIKPNPSLSSFELNFFSPLQSVGLLSLFDLSGKMIYSYEINILKGDNQQYLNSQLKPGLYSIIVQSDFHVYKNKLIQY